MPRVEDQKEMAKNFVVVCKCKAVKYKDIKKAILNGADNLEKVRKKTSANTGCGKKCTEKILEMINEYSKI